MPRIYSGDCRKCGKPTASPHKPECDSCTAKRKRAIAARAAKRLYQKNKSLGKTRVFSERAREARKARLLQEKLNVSPREIVGSNFFTRPSLQYARLTRCQEGVSLKWGVVIKHDKVLVEGGFLPPESIVHLHCVGNDPEQVLSFALLREEELRQEA